MTAQILSPLPYYGGKSLLARRIAATFPPHRHYVEPYAGSLAVLLAKPRSPMETANDLDGDLMLFWQVLRQRPADLARVCALTPHSRVEHQVAFDVGGDLSDLERARRVWVQLSQGRAGIRKRTGWRHYVNPGGSDTGMPDYLDGYVGRILPAAERLAGVSLENRPALDLIGRYGVEPTVLLYVDPPYLGSTRSGSSWNGYQVEMRDDADHIDLAAALHDCAAAVVLSGYPSNLYDALYAGWHRADFAADTGQGDGWGNRTEVLWSNRPLGEPHLFSEVTG